MSSPATQSVPFPQRVLLLGVTWFPATFLLQARTVLRAASVPRSRPDTRVPVNFLLLAIGVLTAVLAAGFSAVFAVIVFDP